MKLRLGILLPEDYASRVESFRAEHPDWQVRPMRSHPHVSIKGPAGLDEGAQCLEMIATVARGTGPFMIALTEPEIFGAEPLIYLGVESPGWWTLHRELVDALGRRPRVHLHPFEISGWIPNTTVMRLKSAVSDLHPDILVEAAQALSPLPSFLADTLRLYRQKHDEGYWETLRGFSLDG